MTHALDIATQYNSKGEFEAAEAVLAPAIAQDPDNLALRLVYSECLAMQLRFETAIEQCLRILHVFRREQTAPLDLVKTLDRLARCAVQIGTPSIILPYLDLLSVRTSPFPSDRCWYPRILAQAGFLQDARGELLQILNDFPGEAFTTHTLGEIMMAQGDRDGLALSRQFSSRDFMRTYFPGIRMAERIWEGEPLDGKSVTIIPWGGHGDYFQFARHVAQVKALGARHVTAVTSGRFTQLLRSAGVDEVVGLSEYESSKERHDFWVSTFGLARADREDAGRRLASGYLTPPPSDIAEDILRAARARAAGRPCIGLYWHSDQMGGDIKSIPLSMLLPLFARPDVHWVILQGGFGLRRLREAGLGTTATIPDGLFPFDDAGALIEGLDGVASICAWPFHLSGAVGTRTWLLAGRVMAARHLNEERESVVYPGCATLARQPKAGDWPGAIARLTEELDTFAAEFAERSRR